MEEATDSARPASGTQLERVFELSSGLRGFGSGGYLRRVNPAFEATLGVFDAGAAVATISGLHPSGRSHSDPRSVPNMRRGHGVTLLERRCIRSHGSEVWLESNVVADHQGWLYGTGTRRDTPSARSGPDRLRAAQPMSAASHREVSVLAEQQAALRQVATMVARGVEPSPVFSVAADELACCSSAITMQFCFATNLTAQGFCSPPASAIPSWRKFQWASGFQPRPTWCDRHHRLPLAPSPSPAADSERVSQIGSTSANCGP